MHFLHLNGGHWVALLDAVVVPPIAADDDGVIPLEPLLRSGANKFLALAEEESVQIYLTGLGAFVLL